MYHVIVDKYHVGLSCRALVREVIHTRPLYVGALAGARMRPTLTQAPGAARWAAWRSWMGAGRAARHSFLRGCIEAHRENRALYLAVMRGHL